VVVPRRSRYGGAGAGVPRPFPPAVDVGGAYSFNGNHAQYDVLPGDSTFVFVRTGGDAVQMILVTNWLDQLRRRRSR
jgi:hypothetical protein